MKGLKIRWCIVTLMCFAFYAIAVAKKVAEVEVPIVNECKNVPIHFKKHWHYRNTFGIILKQNQKVRFRLNLKGRNADLIGDRDVDLTCLQNTRAPELKVVLNRRTPIVHTPITETCTPTVGVLKLCNSPTIHVTVQIDMSDTPEPLPTLRLNSFETYDVDNTNVTKFLNAVKHYGFVYTPRAQVLIGHVDVEVLKKNNQLINGLKQMNDVILKYLEYSGRSSTLYNSPNREENARVNLDIEKHVLLFKSEECIPDLSYYVAKARHDPSMKIDFHNYHAKSYRISCDVGGYYTADRVVAVDTNILGFFVLQGRSWSLLHEIGHHFDLYTADPYIDVRDIWNNIYAAFYQSRFKYNNTEDYWMQDHDSKNVRNLYDNGETLLKMEHRPRAHFLTALFSVDDRESLFREYNIRTMDETQTTENILQSVAIFLKDTCNSNVFPFIDHVVDDKNIIPWLNLTSTYVISESSNFRMPCFYFNTSKPSASPYKRPLEHDFDVISKLRLCPTTDENHMTALTITTKTKELLLDKEILINRQKVNITEIPFVYKSTQTAFVVSAELGNVTFIKPTYIFCKQSVACSLDLIVQKTSNPPIQLLPPVTFHIQGIEDSLIALLHVDYYDLKIRIKTLTAEGHPYFPRKDGPYVTIKMYDSPRKDVFTYNIYGTEMAIEEKSFDFKVGSTVEFNAKEPHRVRIYQRGLNDFDANAFQMTTQGLKLVDSTEPDILVKLLQNNLASDLEYRPNLKGYLHIRALMTLGKNEMSRA